MNTAASEMGKLSAQKQKQADPVAYQAKMRSMAEQSIAKQKETLGAEAFTERLRSIAKLPRKRRSTGIIECKP